MDNELSLKQGGSNCVEIFPPLRSVKLVAEDFDHTKNGYKLEHGILQKGVGQDKNYLKFEVFNPENRTISEAQNCGHFLSTSVRSLHLTCRDILKTLN